MKVLKYITLFCLLMSFGTFAQKVNVKENIYYRVVKVRDGDTVVLLVDNQELPVRLATLILLRKNKLLELRQNNSQVIYVLVRE